MKGGRKPVDITKDTQTFSIKTGEVITGVKVTKDEYIEYKEVDKFIFLYEKFLNSSYLAKMVAKDVMIWMAMNMDSETNIITMNERTRNEAASLLNLSPNAIKNELRRMVNLGWVRRVNRGDYLVNPNYAWRGDRRNRKKAVDLYDAKRGDSIENFENQK